MNITERSRHARRVATSRRVFATAVLAAATTTVGCDKADGPIVPAAEASLDRGDVTARERLLPRAPSGHRRPAPHPSAQPAHVGTALVVRRLRVSAYCDHAQPTYTGVWPRKGMAAVKASTGIGFGAVLHVAGRGRFVVTDREPPYGSSDVDLFEGWRPDCESWAARFGVQHLDVTIEERAA